MQVFKRYKNQSRKKGGQTYHITKQKNYSLFGFGAPAVQHPEDWIRLEGNGKVTTKDVEMGKAIRRTDALKMLKSEQAASEKKFQTSLQQLEREGAVPKIQRALQKEHKTQREKETSIALKMFGRK